MAKTKKEKGQDLTSADANSTAAPINYPDEVMQVVEEEKELTTDDMVRVKKELRDIEFQFSDEELQEKGKKLAEAHIEKAKIEAEKKAVNEKFNEQIKGEQSKIDILSKHIDEGYEEKTVTVEVRKNFDTGMREYWYKDVKRAEDPLTAEDHQPELFEQTFTDEVDEEKEEMLLKIVAGDYVMTSSGLITQITQEDIEHGIEKHGVERLATQDEINEFVAQ